MQTHNAMFKFKLAGGGGFCTPVGAVRDVRAHKKPDKAIIMVLWGKNHGRTGGHKGQVMDMVAVGDWRKLRKRWMALKSTQA